MPKKDALMQGFQMGPWFVLPERGLLRLDGEEKRIEPLVMDVLVVLAECQGDVLSNDQLIEKAWGGRAVGDDVIVRCIAVLRKNLGDDARNPDYIENIPRRGYRLKMPVEAPEIEKSEGTAPLADQGQKPRPAYYWPLLAGFLAVIGIAFFAFFAPIDEDDGINTLAVFPMECAENDRHLCYGIVEELVSQLLQAQGSNEIKVVISRKDFPDDPQEITIADELDVDRIFLGSLKRSGNNIHISAEIKNRQDGFNFWSDSYDGSENQLVKMRSALVDDAVRKLIGKNASLLKADRRPQSIEAFEAYSEGQYLLSIRSAESIRKAIRLFEKTIELDPVFGMAHIRLAYAYVLLPEYTTESNALMYEKALSSADAGVNIDPGLAGPAQTVYGFIYHKRGQWTRATEAHEKAINAPTVYPISHQLYSRLLASVGRLDASLAEARKAHEIDPQQAVQTSRLAIAYFWVDDLENAAIYFRLSNARKEYEAAVHDLAYSLFLIREGDYDKAVAEAITGLTKYELDSSWVVPVYAGLHDPEKYDEAYAIVAAMAEGNLLQERVELSLWALLGDGDRAMAVARKFAYAGEVFEAELMFIPQFSVLREHSEFPALLDSIGLIDYWSNNGCEWQGDGVVCAADADLVVAQ